MGVVVTFEDYTPSPRYDSLPWTEVRIEEAADQDGPWTQIDVIALSPVDLDPENPQARSFTTQEGTGESLWYRVVFADADGDTLQPTEPVHNTSESNPPTVTPYAGTAELARALRIASPTPAQGTAMLRVLTAAALEIDSELDRTNPFGTPYPDLVVEVNIERAVEHWRQMESAFGLVGIGDSVPILSARDSWDRHAHKLAPLKEAWGLA